MAKETYKKIPDKLYEFLRKVELSGAEFRVFFAIYEKTAGFHKKQDYVSNSQISQLCGGMPERTVIKSTESLQLLQIIRLVRKGTSSKSPNLWELDIDRVLERGLLQKPALLQKKVKTTAKKGKKLLQKIATTKDNIQKIIPNGTQTAISTSGEFGNKAINELVVYFEGKLGASLDQSRESNRRQCYNLLRRFAKDFPQQDSVMLVKRLIDLALSDDFHQRNATSFVYLQRNALKIIAAEDTLFINKTFVQKRDIRMIEPTVSATAQQQAAREQQQKEKQAVEREKEEIVKKVREHQAEYLKGLGDDRSYFEVMRDSVAQKDMTLVRQINADFDSKYPELAKRRDELADNA